MLKIIADLVTGLFSIPVLFSILYLVTLFKIKPKKSSLDFKKLTFDFDENSETKEKNKHNEKEN